MILSTVIFIKFLGYAVSSIIGIIFTGPAERVHLLHIKDGEVGHSYLSVFKKCLDGNVEWAEIQDPYLRTKHQIHNLVRFCELLVKHCKKLREVKLTTVRGEGHNYSPVSSDELHVYNSVREPHTSELGGEYYTSHTNSFSF